MVVRSCQGVVFAVEVAIIDAETTGQGLLLSRLLVIVSGELGVANRVTINDDEKAIMTRVTSVQLVDAG